MRLAQRIAALENAIWQREEQADTCKFEYCDSRGGVWTSDWMERRYFAHQKKLAELRGRLDALKAKNREPRVERD